MEIIKSNIENIKEKINKEMKKVGFNPYKGTFSSSDEVGFYDDYDTYIYFYTDVKSVEIRSDEVLNLELISTIKKVLEMMNNEL